MRNIGLVSAAVIAMAAMAGAVAASAPPVMRSQDQQIGERMNGLIKEAEEQIVHGVRQAEEAGVSGEAAQQRITAGLSRFIQGTADEYYASFARPDYATDTELTVAVQRARRNLINNNQLRSGSDGDLAVSAVLAERNAAWRAERNMEGRNRYSGGSLTGDGGVPRGTRPSCSMRGLPDGCDAPRNVPGNEAAGQPATDAATTGIRRSRATYDSDLDDGYDPDLDDEAGEPD